MRTSGLAVAVVTTIAGLGCFSTARYDAAHVQRVVDIHARYDAVAHRLDDWYASSIAALAQLRATVIAIAPGSSHAPVRRIEDRPDLVECRRQCAGAQCLRDICQPAYADALIKTYFHADETWVTQQLLASTHTDVESVLAFAHNQALQRTVDQQATTIEQHQRDARHRLDRARETEIRASLQRRDTDIASGRAARRARVKAKAEAFEAKHRPLPTLDRMTYAPRAPSRQPTDTAQ